MSFTTFGWSFSQWQKACQYLGEPEFSIEAIAGAPYDRHSAETVRMLEVKRAWTSKRSDEPRDVIEIPETYRVRKL